MNLMKPISYFKESRISIILIFMAVFSLIFDNIPKMLQLTTLSSGYSSKLTWYFLFSLLMFYLYKIKTDGLDEDKNDFKCFIRYSCFFLGILLISNIWGLFSYPYYDELLAGPISQIEKLPSVLLFLNKHGVYVEQKSLTILWIGMREIKGSILDVLYTFGFSFILYQFFKKDSIFYYSLITKAVMAAIMVLSLYSIIELFYLYGNDTATYILKVINPLIHPIAVDHGWWPPLLWKGQLRSMFSEPSRMGNYLAFALPFILGKYLLSNKKQVGLCILITFYTVMIFFTRARTAVAVYWGILFLLFLGVLYIHNKDVTRKFICICGISLVSLALSIGFINLSSHKNVERPQVTVASYMEDNIGSLGSSNKRSNGARYALIRSNFATGIEHPILGVGNILNSAYTVHHFNEADLSNHEVQMWVRNYSEQGVLKYSLNAMNEYVSRFAQNGILGLIVYVFPFLYATTKLLKILREAQGLNQVKVMITMLSLIGSAVAGCNGSLTLLYAYWIILPFSYAVIQDFHDKNKVMEEK